MKKALLVIDMQNEMIGEKHAPQFNYNAETLLQSVNEVIDVNKSNMVVYIKHIMKKNLINKFASFHTYEGTENAELVPSLHIVSDYVLSKHNGNAFSNPQLHNLLKEHNIECVEVIGVDGGWCVSLTAIGAVKAGYRVIMNESAIGTIYHKRKEVFSKKLRNANVKFI